MPYFLVFTRHDRAIPRESRQQTVTLIFDCFGNVTVKIQHNIVTKQKRTEDKVCQISTIQNEAPMVIGHGSEHNNKHHISKAGQKAATNRSCRHSSAIKRE